MAVTFLHLLLTLGIWETGQAPPLGVRGRGGGKSLPGGGCLDTRTKVSRTGQAGSHLSLRAAELGELSGRHAAGSQGLCCQPQAQVAAKGFLGAPESLPSCPGVCPSPGSPCHQDQTRRRVSIRHLQALKSSSVPSGCRDPWSPAPQSRHAGP